VTTSLDGTAAGEALAAREQGTRRPGPFRRAGDVWRYRELLVNLTRKELKVKYKNSALGFVWSLLNPALYLVVFYVVFDKILQAGLPSYPIFLLTGLLPWNLFSTALGSSTTSISGNAGLVGKVWFPREILPLASIGAALVHFFLQMLVLCAALVAFRYSPSWDYLWLVLPGLLTLLVFLAALAIACSAINVYARDTQHLLELVLLAWFWMTPIVYTYEQVRSKIGSWYLANPMVSVVLAFQRGIYGKTSYDDGSGTLVRIIPDASVLWYFRNLAIVAAVSFGLLLVALWIFGRLEDNLAEEI
jgi:ABC-2 type transport system permease protein